jgi:hypothetical protein
MDEKVDFLKHQFVPLLRQIPSDTLPHWGTMTLQQMIEHFTDNVRLASGKVQLTEMFTPEEEIPKYQAFIMSDKPFRENTRNPIFGDLNYEQNVRLLYKHALHHLRQFGLTVS